MYYIREVPCSDLGLEMAALLEVDCHVEGCEVMYPCNVGNHLRCVTAQKTTIDIFTAVKTSNL